MTTFLPQPLPISDSRMTYPGGGTHVHFVENSSQPRGEMSQSEHSKNLSIPL